MRIAVSGVGIISSIGYGTEEVLLSLRCGRSGIGALTLFDSVHGVAVGEVKYDNDTLKRLLGLDERSTFTRTALLGISAASAALADAEECEGLRTGLVSATSTGGMDLTEGFFEEFSKDSSRGRLRNVVGHECADSTHKIAEYLGITGFRTTISTACSSAANAIILGAGLIRQGLLDRVVVGGTDALCKFTINGFQSLMILDPDLCRPFDDTRKGLNLGEGAGYIVLQREDTLTREPYGFLTGYANANDAFHQTASSSEGEGAFRAMSEALEMSKLLPSDIDYINVHGTGTINNDASEAAALVRIFRDKIPPFSSTKPFTGHTLAAAGGVEAVISLLAMKYGIIFPNLNYGSPIDENSPVPHTSLTEGVEIRNVLSNSFGFGGNNSSLIFSAH